MLVESEVIPYEPARLRGERLLVLAPHPDDEAIACGGLVALHAREGRVVRVVIATDGAEAGEAAAREEESVRGLAHLASAAPLFLRFRDRHLDEDRDALIARLRDELLAFLPDLILVPSPIEIHPDHFALADAFVELVQRDDTLFADLAAARVAFYEVGQPLRPNAIVDITEVADAKYAAIGEHQTQLAVRDYTAYARGLNAYRAMTMPATVTLAEAYFVIDLPKLRTTSWTELRDLAGAPASIEVREEQPKISVVIRTKDRPRLLREAIASARHATEIVVVNDGGAKLDAIDGVTLVEHETSHGRAEAANAGARAATSPFLVFLDDDDLQDPEHLHVLARASRARDAAAWYTDALSVFLTIGENGDYRESSRLRLYATDFDRELLLVDNYIPLPTLLIPKSTFLDLGGFDPAFDLFEDWDFLIRLAERGDFVRVPRLTVEIRHFQGGGSIILEAPEGSPRYREAKLRIWRKHAAKITNDVIADVFERQKRRMNNLFSEAVEAKGRRQLGDIDASRLAREKDELIASIQDLHERLNATTVREHHASGAMHALRAEVMAMRRENEEMAARLELVSEQNAALHRAVADSNSTAGALASEVTRLQSLLDMIYRSRTWKLHNAVERMKGRR